MFRSFLVIIIVLCSSLFFSISLVEAWQTEPDLPEPAVTSISMPDSLVRIGLTDTDIVAINSVKTVDVLLKIPGMQAQDLGLLGQFSSVGYNGMGKNHVIPILNDIPLMTESFGTWNWLDIPYYIISSIHLNEGSPKNIPGAFSTINIKSKYFAPAIPFSNVNYRIGDFGFNHVDVTLARKFGENRSFYASGSSEKLPGSLAENRYRGSNVWLQLNHLYRGIGFTWQTLISDKNMREIAMFPKPGEPVIKDMRHSHNVKMISLEVDGLPGIEYDKLMIYYSQVKDQAQGSLLYSDDFFNLDKKLGFLLSKSGYTFRKWSLGYHVNGSTTKIVSRFWNVQNRINTLGLSVDAVYDLGEHYSLTALPEIYARTNMNGLSVFGEIVFSYNPSDELSASFSAGRHGRFKSIAEETMESGNFAAMSGKQVDKINSYKANIKYDFKDVSLEFTPFFYSNQDPAIYLYTSGENLPENTPGFSNAIKQDINSIKNGGVGINLEMGINKYSRLEMNYTYQGGKKSQIVNPPHSAFLQLNVKDLEDKFISLIIDTEFNINVFYRSAGQQLAYLPLFQQIVQTDNETQSILGVKLRGSASVKTLTIFYELDYLSSSGYQYVLGFPSQKRKIRVGLSWDFNN